MNANRVMTVLAILAVLSPAGCGGQTEQAPSTATAAVTSAGSAVLQDLDAATLRMRAQASLQAQRFFAPAGDNALEYTLALRGQLPADPGARAALDDLEPELVIAVERSVARGSYPEARRLFGLLERVDAAAPAVPRLRTVIATAESEAARALLAADTEAKAHTEAEDTALQLQAAARAAALTEASVAKTARIPLPPPVTPAPVTPAAAATPERQAPPSLAAAEPPSVATPDVPRAAPAARAPRLLRDAQPQYPVTERSRALKGTVQVAFTIDASGQVQAPRVVASTLPRTFERAALQAAARWKFEATGQEQAGARTVSFAPVGN